MQKVRCRFMQDKTTSYCQLIQKWHTTYLVIIHGVLRTEESEKRDREVRETETEKVAGKEQVVRETEKRVISRF